MSVGLLADPAEVRKHLVAAAAAGESITYSQLLNVLGHPFSRPRMRALCKTLALIDEEAAERGEPELAVLVVRQSDGLPGQGWWVGGGAIRYGYDGLWTGPEAARLVTRLQRQAFDYWGDRSANATAG
ncbi:MAG TPA: ribose-phosphate pyrophosphokinase [Sphingomicrobium sp.]|nr:ribose-phosphate pyrophosphokinase [Sphingomicrobium sp.]